KSGVADAATADKEMAEQVTIEAATIDTDEAPYFIDLVKSQLAQRYDEKDLATQNLTIYTSLDLPLQILAQQVLTSGLDRVGKMIRRKRSEEPVQGALIALEPSTGAVLALVGGRSYGPRQ